MGDKSIQACSLLCRKPLPFLFFIATIGAFFTWFNLLNAASHPNFVDHSFSIDEKLVFVSEDQYFPESKDKDFLAPSHLSNNNDIGIQETKSCDPRRALLKVFMYDLPPEFHFSLLDWESQGNKIWPDIRNQTLIYPGGLNIQHSVEYWLTLDLLSSRFHDRNSLCNAVRVTNSTEADVIFVPFFSSLSYNRPLKAKNTNRDKVLQEKLVKFLKGRREWMKSGGHDHVIVAHHPNSMSYVRAKVSSATFILADFGRYLQAIANIDKDVIAPYKHLVATFDNDSSGFDARPTLMYFQGAIFRKAGGIIRRKLYNLLRNKPNVHFSFGSIKHRGIAEATKGMRSSKFCLHIAGDTPSSNRLFDAITSHCVPVIVSDHIELPYEDILDYSQFCIFVRSSDAIKKDYLFERIKGVSKEEWSSMWERLKEVEGYFEYRFSSVKDDAVQMIWQAVARKVPGMKRREHRFRRFNKI
ncbi:uncharacterized protein A4U43_C02F15210 [Asparagus officinalis]|uniref:Exostosin GT47 domain-containing protein n=1 Tax=Asparagus officinalis TaxID=4686 RepID=A0A5P1FL72_ASPOF|nr:probable arabinosyltransferase ARAD1 [Asparagus officinalis]ONK78167.1 uncharacterized protein A4U43_C02F15210 [Asparagus officinalis]